MRGAAYRSGPGDDADGRVARGSTPTGRHATRRRGPGLYRGRGLHAAPRTHGGRRATALAAGFVALVSWALVAGPAEAASAQGPCALQRTGARHSEGLSTWNGDYRRPLGDIDAVMAFLSFPDHVPDTAPAVLAADHFPGTTDFLARASYGRLRLRPHVVRRWFAMPRPSTAYRIGRDWAPRPRDAYLRDAVAAIGRSVDFRRYPVVYLVADPDAPGVDSDATKVINLVPPLPSGRALIHRLVTVFERHPPDTNVLAHETNHLFDLPDLYFRPATLRAADWDTRVGDWDLMGSQFALAPDLFAWHRWKYGWIDRAQVVCVDHPGTTIRVLTPVEVPGGVKLVVVRLDATTALAMEARAARGNDARTCSEGVLLYRVRSDVPTGQGPIRVIDTHPGTAACHGSAVYPPLADAPLETGESYTYRLSSYPHGTVSVRVGPGTPDGGRTVTVVER